MGDEEVGSELVGRDEGLLEEGRAVGYEEEGLELVG